MYTFRYLFGGELKSTTLLGFKDKTLTYPKDVYNKS